MPTLYGTIYYKEIKVRNFVRSVNLAFLLLLSLPAVARTAQKEPAAAATPISIHPANPKYFLFRGKPLALITATEHYGSVINSRFDFERYLRDAADKKQTLTRLFLLFREQQSQRNPYSPLKVESPDFVTPYLRSGPGKALDGEPKSTSINGTRSILPGSTDSSPALRSWALLWK